MTVALRLAAAVLLPLLAGAACHPWREPVSSNARTAYPPPAPRELRAAWVATVANIDWPSRPGLGSAEQQAEILAIVERAKELNLNALVLQVRPSADAIYPSEREPWSEYLTGQQGKPPEPLYDPLKMWTDEAHRRGIELHAWFNPYRARHTEAKSPPAPNHVSATHPSMVKSYGGFLWMDPGEAAAVERTVDVILDVVRRYDIDGVHIDDYFYPYPVKAPSTSPNPPSTEDEDFPDGPSWQAYLAGGGALGRADWRRKNVSDLIERLYEGVHREKRWVKCGISPFGLGRPERRPASITGFSQYDKLYADVELWLQKGWLDYLSPQLYWPIEEEPHAFGVLLDYWLRENTRGRHIWPGLYTSRLDGTPNSWMPEEVLRQIEITRAKDIVRGQVHFSMISLLQNRRRISDRLGAGPYATAALVPASPWLGDVPPPAPSIEVTTIAAEGTVSVRLSAPRDEAIARYALWARYGAAWRFSVVPRAQPYVGLASRTSSGTLEVVVASAIDRVGNEGPRVRVALR